MTGKAAGDDGYVVPDLESTSEIPVVPPRAAGEPALLEDFFSTQDVSRDRMPPAAKARRRKTRKGSQAAPAVDAFPVPTDGAGSVEGTRPASVPGPSAQTRGASPMTAFDLPEVTTERAAPGPRPEAGQPSEPGMTEGRPASPARPVTPEGDNERADPGTPTAMPADSDPKAADPKAAGSGVAASGVADLMAAGSEVADPKVAVSVVAGPEVPGSELAGSDGAASGVVDFMVAGSEVADSEAADSEVAGSGVAASGVADLKAADSEAADVKAAGSETVDPATGDCGTAGLKAAGSVATGPWAAGISTTRSEATVSQAADVDESDSEMTDPTIGPPAVAPLTAGSTVAAWGTDPAVGPVSGSGTSGGSDPLTGQPAVAGVGSGPAPAGSTGTEAVRGSTGTGPAAGETQDPRSLDDDPGDPPLADAASPSESSPEDVTAPRRPPEPKTDVMVADPGWATGRAPAPTREEAVPDSLQRGHTTPSGGSPVWHPGGPPPVKPLAGEPVTVETSRADLTMGDPAAGGSSPPADPRLTGAGPRVPGGAAPFSPGVTVPSWQAGPSRPKRRPQRRTVAGLIAAAGAAAVAGVFVLLFWPDSGSEQDAQAPKSCPASGCSAATKKGAANGGGNGIPAGTRLVYRTVEQDAGYFEGTVTIVNRSGQAMPSWSLAFSYPGADIRNTWEAVIQQRGQDVVIANAATSRPIPPGGTFEVRFGGSGTPSMPQNCRLNGRPCAFSG